MKNTVGGFGVFDKSTYRICYGLTLSGKIDYSTPLYEFEKRCNCESCSKRFRYDGGLKNCLTVTTDDTNRFAEIEKIMNDYTCGSIHHIARKYISMKNGDVTEKVFI